MLDSRAPITSTDQIRTIYANINGGHWFDPDTLRWLGSRIHAAAYPTPTGALFVTSEWTGFDHAGRAFTIRRFTRSTGDIDTVNTFGGYHRRDTAHAVARRLARGEGGRSTLNVCQTPQTVTCGACGLSWCEGCDPCPAALCHRCHGRGYTTALVVT